MAFLKWGKAVKRAFSHSQNGHFWCPKQKSETCSEIPSVTWYVVRNSLTFGYWKVVFSLFLILCTWENSSFAKEEGIHRKMYKTKLVHCCEVVPNLVVYVKNFNFCLFVCLYLTFCQFRKRIWSNHISKNCSEIKTVTWSVIWLWKLQITIFDLFWSALMCGSCLRQKIFWAYLGHILEVYWAHRNASPGASSVSIFGLHQASIGCSEESDFNSCFYFAKQYIS